jgi:hypothetical protein
LARRARWLDECCCWLVPETVAKGRLGRIKVL